MSVQASLGHRIVMVIVGTITITMTAAMFRENEYTTAIRLQKEDDHVGLHQLNEWQKLNYFQQIVTDHSPFIKKD
jgi:hypothetical protein